MQPSQVRQKILDDHKGLRAQLERLEGLALDIQAERNHQLPLLRDETQRLLDTLLVHMQWEDEHLGPILFEIDAWGEERARRLHEEHVEQRQRLSLYLAALLDESRPEKDVAGDLLELIAWLRDDMAGEERVTLDPDVVRDDVVGIDVETG